MTAKLDWSKLPWGPTTETESDTVRKLRQYAADSDALAQQYAEAIADGGYSTAMHHANANGHPFTLCGLRKFTAATATAKQRIERSTFSFGAITCAECKAEVAAIEAESAAAPSYVCGGCGRGAVRNDGDLCGGCE